MWSASMIVETRWATTMTAVCRVTGLSADRSLASVDRSRAEKLSSNRKTSGLATRARAMASRWRWPPETLVPPWAIGDVQALRHGPDEVLGLGDPQRLPQLVVGRVGVAVAQVGGDRAGEQVGLLRHQADPRPDVLERRVADVDPAEPHRPTGDVVEPRDQGQQGGLAGTGAADDGGGPARLGGQRNPLQDRHIRTRVAELDVAQLDPRCRCAG